MDAKRLLKRSTRAVLEYLEETIPTGHIPTQQEIADHTGLASTQIVHYHLARLENLGYINRPGGWRSIQLIEEPVGLPLAGIIAAGQPIEAIENIERIDLGSLYEKEKHFLLRVKGESMIDDHIADGDLVVVEKSERCFDGDVVIAILDNGEATMKRFYKGKNRIRLEPANSRMRPIYSKNVKIQGIVVGVIRITI